jgi:AcrR family transcriptional regulator
MPRLLANQPDDQCPWGHSRVNRGEFQTERYDLPMTGAGNRRGRKARGELLGAGLAVLRTLAPSELLAGLHPRAVAAQVPGRTAGSVYYQFGSHAGYVDALLDHVVRSSAELTRWLGEIAQTLAASSEVPDTNLVRHLQEIAELEESLVVENTDMLRVQLALWICHDDPGARERLLCMWREADTLMAGAYSAILDRWDREVRPPLTLDGVSVLLASVVTGLALRRAAEPDRTPPDLIGHTVLALLPALTRPRGDGADLYSYLERFGVDDWLRVRPEPGEPVARRPRARAADDIVRVTLRLADEADFERLTIEQIAAAADVHPSTVHDHFGTKAGLAAAAFAQASRPVLERIATALHDGIPPLDVIYTAARDIAELSRRHRSVFRAMLAGVVGAVSGAVSASMPLTDAAAHFQPAVAAAQADGSLRADVASLDVANTLAATLYMHLVVWPKAQPDEHVEFLRKAVVEGLAGLRVETG